MHAFWKESDPVQVQVQTTMFLKNISMLGAAFLISYFGSGPLSLDSIQEKKKYDAEIKKEVSRLIKAN
jgi:uncharacterized membrane protein YphA (DoxX/SURF4 family)